MHDTIVDITAIVSQRPCCHIRDHYTPDDICINYSLDNQNNVLCYRRFDFVPYVAQLVAPLVSIHVVGLPDPYRLPYMSARFV